MNRSEAAAWVTDVTGSLVTHSTLRYWESEGVGLLRRQRPGHRQPARYGLRDLVVLRIVADLRRDGALLERVRRAVRNLRKALPGIERAASAGQIAVTSTGDVVALDSERILRDLTLRSGRSVSITLVPIGTYVEQARDALVGKAQLP